MQFLRCPFPTPYEQNGLFFTIFPTQCVGQGFPAARAPKLPRYFKYSPDAHPSPNKKDHHVKNPLCPSNCPTPPWLPSAGRIRHDPRRLPRFDTIITDINKSALGPLPSPRHTRPADSRAMVDHYDTSTLAEDRRPLSRARRPEGRTWFRRRRLGILTSN